MVLERNRSNELYTIFDVAKSAKDAAATPQPTRSGLHSTTEVQTFNRFAKAFAKDISGASDTILRLTQLLKRQNVFDDQSSEVGGLTQMIKSTLQRLHGDLETLELLKQRALQSQSGQTERRPWGRDSGTSSTVQHGNAVVDSLKNRLARTGQDFRSTLQLQSQSMKNNASRRHLFTSGDRPQTFESALFHDQEQLQQQQQLITSSSNTHYYGLRADVAQDLEGAIEEVGVLFNDFTRLVHEQDELVLRIDSNVDTALRHVNAGSNELMRYFANLSTNRGLILKIFFVLFMFLLFFGFVVVR